MLGSGVYASHTYDKAYNHGKRVLAEPFVVFKLLVYVGKVYRYDIRMLCT